MQTNLDTLCSDWHLLLTGEKQETHSSHLYFARQNKNSVVLKIFKEHSDEKQSANILMQYNGNGAVKVLKSSDQTVLLERITPGRTLAELVLNKRDDTATEIFCQVATKLHSAEIDASNFSPISSLLDTFNRYLKSDDATLSKKLVSHAESVFQELVDSQTSQVLLHGDLHHDNILQDDTNGWVAIDPKGYVGEREAEVSCFLKNPRDNRYYANADIINSRIEIISNTLNLDPGRILLWTYSMYVMSMIWSIEDGNYNPKWQVMLEVLQKMLNADRLDE